MLSIVLSELRQVEWLEMKLDPEDVRIKLYKLKDPENAFKEMKK
jgi:hypothetical protein